MWRVAPALLLCSSCFAVPLVQLDTWGDNSVRVRIAAPGNVIADPPISGLLPQPPNGTVTASSPVSVTIGNLRVIADSVTGFVTAIRVSDGATVLRMTGLAFSEGPLPMGSPSMLLSFAGVNASERIVGFGQQKDFQVVKKLPFFRSIEASEYYAYTDPATNLTQMGGQALVSFYMSSAGYGVLLSNGPGYGYINISHDAVQLYHNATPQADFWITTTPATPSANGTLPGAGDGAYASVFAPLLRQYADVVGHAPPFPYWATGFVQSKDRYRNQTQLLDVARGYVSRGLPVGMIVIDWFSWKQLGDWTFNPTCWPDPAGMVRELQDLGIEPMVSFWPFMNSSSVHWPLYDGNKNWLAVNRSSGAHDVFWWCEQCEDAGGALVDTTNPAVRADVWSHFWESYGKLGFKAVWLDETEPDRFGYTYGQWDLAAGSDYEVGAGWKKTWIRTMSDGFQSAGYKPGEYFILSRSMWAGTQQYGNTIWSGDTWCTWQMLQLQLTTGVGAGLSGQGSWTSDIGGYACAGQPSDDPVWQELFVRWWQLASFSPVFRLHGHRDGGPPPNECGPTNGDNELWTLFDEGSLHYSAAVRAMLLRESLRDYVQGLHAEHSSTGLPLMRPVWLQFPGDAGAVVGDAAIETQYMFGPDWLVAPVYEYQATNRSVYLPALNASYEWLYWWNQTSYGQGGAWVTVSTPLDEFPLFLRQETQAGAA